MTRCCMYSFAYNCISFNLPGVGADIVLDAFGEYFIIYCLEHGYDKMLRTLGDSFESFIQNLDSLHTLLRMSYTKMEAPSFRFVSYILPYCINICWVR